MNTPGSWGGNFLLICPGAMVGYCPSVLCTITTTTTTTEYYFKLLPLMNPFLYTEYSEASGFFLYLKLNYPNDSMTL